MFDIRRECARFNVIRLEVSAVRSSLKCILQRKTVRAVSVFLIDRKKRAIRFSSYDCFVCRSGPGLNFILTVRFDPCARACVVRFSASDGLLFGFQTISPSVILSVLYQWVRVCWRLSHLLLTRKDGARPRNRRLFPPGAVLSAHVIINQSIVREFRRRGKVVGRPPRLGLPVETSNRDQYGGIGMKSD